ncbi:hypothetical protein [Brevibacillus laterosporus]|uniref:hypothetical protein n=1 Tax=Brevibacillus laterosporus TaxID=1465 RepID=UPI0018CD3324|nr:hypothetical protein [Brevibacillus laterosporus]
METQQTMLIDFLGSRSSPEKRISPTDNNQTYPLTTRLRVKLRLDIPPRYELSKAGVRKPVEDDTGP